jgi:hypothetical protein
MTETAPAQLLPDRVKLEFCQVEPPPDEAARPIEIGKKPTITSSDRLCVVEIQNMEGEAIATFRVRETSRWLAQNNYHYIAGTNGLYRRVSTSLLGSILGSADLQWWWRPIT